MVTGRAAAGRGASAVRLSRWMLLAGLTLVGGLAALRRR
jgi:hypothetical protein